MDKLLMQKLIKTYNDTCPDFTYENPVADAEVASALSKSFVKLLTNEKSMHINKNLRKSALENIRKMCQIEAENHAQVNDKIANDLTEFYLMQISSETNRTSIVESVDKQLDDFLVRHLKITSNITSSKSSANPDVMKALLNVNKDGLFLNTLFKDVINWNEEDEKFVKLLRNLWKSDLPLNICDDISIKLKAEFERVTLEFCFNILTIRDINLKYCLEQNKELMDIVKKCSQSKNCFQICFNMLNSLFIATNFDLQLEKFIQFFIEEIKKNRQETLSVLYPLTLSHIAVMMDFEIDSLPEPVKFIYTKATLLHLEKLNKECTSDLIMLLSHYPQWFNLYLEFHNKEIV